MDKSHFGPMFFYSSGLRFFTCQMRVLDQIILINVFYLYNAIIVRILIGNAHGFLTLLLLIFHIYRVKFAFY